MPRPSCGRATAVRSSGTASPTCCRATRSPPAGSRRAGRTPRRRPGTSSTTTPSARARPTGTSRRRRGSRSGTAAPTGASSTSPSRSPRPRCRRRRRRTATPGSSPARTTRSCAPWCGCATPAIARSTSSCRCTREPLEALPIPTPQRLLLGVSPGAARAGGEPGCRGRVPGRPARGVGRRRAPSRGPRRLGARRRAARAARRLHPRVRPERLGPSGPHRAAGHRAHLTDGRSSPRARSHFSPRPPTFAETTDLGAHDSVVWREVGGFAESDGARGEARKRVRLSRRGRRRRPRAPLPAPRPGAPGRAATPRTACRRPRCRTGARRTRRARSAP